MTSIDSWSRRISRADALVADEGPAVSLVRFYASLHRDRQKIHDMLETKRPTGPIESDIALVLESGFDLLRTVNETGPDLLAAEARRLLDSPESVRQGELLTYWRARSDRLFFPKALLQPYVEWLTRGGSGPIAGAAIAGDNSCPRCGGAPQLSILEGGAAMSGDGSSRRLQCATCLTTWPFRRVICPSCGSDDERTLGYHQSPTYPHVRVDTCNRCGRYLKTIDLDRMGVAVPVVDEVAAAPLDLWAHERGYEKIELN